MGSPDPERRSSTGAWKMAGAGMELAAALVAFVLIGLWIDRHFETDPWGILICSAIGIIGGMYNLVRRYVHEMFRPPNKK